MPIVTDLSSPLFQSLNTVERPTPNLLAVSKQSLVIGISFGAQRIICRWIILYAQYTSMAFLGRNTMCNTLRVANDDPGEKWASELVKRVGLAVKKARDGKSAAWLSERTAELGYRISPTVIAKLDSGHRGNVLNVAELLVLAAALEVPPLVLLYPDLADGEVELIPGRPGSSWDAYLWATGEAPSFTNPGARPSKGAELLAATRRRAELIATLPGLQIAAAAAPDELVKAALKTQESSNRDEIDRLSALIRDNGGVIHDA
ncbi:hypothetical protein [Mycobacterium sp. HNNTM2301]|uniref:hypothetical protein n=1 Tax=Mycobacterium hainanense TaxID=3289775 RepID=UPI0035A5ACAB